MFSLAAAAGTRRFRLCGAVGNIDSMGRWRQACGSLRQTAAHVGWNGEASPRRCLQYLRSRIHQPTTQVPARRHLRRSSFVCKAAALAGGLGVWVTYLHLLYSLPGVPDMSYATDGAPKPLLSYVMSVIRVLLRFRVLLVPPESTLPLPNEGTRRSISSTPSSK